MNEQVQYQEWILSTTVTAVRNGEVSLRRLVELCEGADPLTVRSAIAAVSTEGLEVSLSLDCPAIPDGPIERRLPPPHPLDYEWRFSRRGAEAILSRVRAAGATETTFMGATTAAITAARQGGWGRLVAFDRSRTILEAVRSLDIPVELVVTNVYDHMPTVGHSDAVIIDPPWYQLPTCAFLAAAARECRKGGLVFASLPGVGTRPGILAERADLIQRAASFGLEVQSRESQCIAYETPLFERNALRAAGLRGDLRSWRRGDLWTFRKVAAPASFKSPLTEPVDAWNELMIGQMRVRLLSAAEPCGDTRLEQVVDDDVLPTVSRRDCRRDLVRVWTSGNRVFGCKDSGTLLAALAARMTGQFEVEAAETRLRRAMTNTERSWLAASCDRIGQLSVTEQDEYEDHTGEDSSDESVAA